MTDKVSPDTKRYGELKHAEVFQRLCLLQPSNGALLNKRRLLQNQRKFVMFSVSENNDWHTCAHTGVNAGMTVVMLVIISTRIIIPTTFKCFAVRLILKSLTSRFETVWWTGLEVLKVWRWETHAVWFRQKMAGAGKCCFATWLAPKGLNRCIPHKTNILSKRKEIASIIKFYHKSIAEKIKQNHGKTLILRRRFSLLKLQGLRGLRTGTVDILRFMSQLSKSLSRLIY